MRVTMHYHGTPITSTAIMLTLAGRCFCVSHARPDQVRLCHEIGQSVMLDNGAFSKFTRGGETDWPAFYAWCDPWLDYPTTWAVIPDVIDAGSQEQDALLREWPHGEKGAPVWHMDEPLDRLLRLIDEWPRVCIGSTGDFWQIMSPSWERRMDAAWTAIARRNQRTPTIHMLRGMQLSAERWPLASVDSTDVAQNHHRPQNTARAMADRWDAAQCPARFAARAPQSLLFEEPSDE
ncbi:MAG: hypothetical protein KGL39_25190 [Patescibacteria group bacterium]|nr:hypothetical protein [Patescibacteria group bacterium]